MYRPRFNFKVKYTYWYWDSKNSMVLAQPFSWGEPTGPQRDAIGRTVDAYYTYRDSRMLNGVKRCWEKVEYEYSNNPVKRFFQRLWRRGKDYYYQGYRYPTHEESVGLSRDHTLGTIYGYLLSDMPKEELKEFVTHLRYKISSFANFTPTSWLWIRAVIGYKWAEYLFYAIHIPTMFFNVVWNWAIYKYLHLEPESSQADWKKILNDQKPPRVAKWVKRLYPIFGLLLASWNIYLLPNSWMKRLSQRIMLLMTPRYNYVIKMLLGDKKSFTKDDVYAYKSMTSNRWSGILQPYVNDRDLEINTNLYELRYNVLDVDMVRKMYDDDSMG